MGDLRDRLQDGDIVVYADKSNRLYMKGKLIALQNEEPISTYIVRKEYNSNLVCRDTPLCTINKIYRMNDKGFIKCIWERPNWSKVKKGTKVKVYDDHLRKWLNRYFYCYDEHNEHYPFSVLKSLDDPFTGQKGVYDDTNYAICEIISDEEN